MNTILQIGAVLTLLSSTGTGGYLLYEKIDKKADVSLVMAVNDTANMGLNEALNYNNSEIKRLEKLYEAGRASEFEKEQLRTLKQRTENIQRRQRIEIK